MEFDPSKRTKSITKVLSESYFGNKITFRKLKSDYTPDYRRKRNSKLRSCERVRKYMNVIPDGWTFNTFFTQPMRSTDSVSDELGDLILRNVLTNLINVNYLYHDESDENFLKCPWVVFW